MKASFLQLLSQKRWLVVHRKGMKLLIVLFKTYSRWLMLSIMSLFLASLEIWIILKKIYIRRCIHFYSEPYFARHLDSWCGRKTRIDFLDTSFKGEIFFKTSQTSQILKSGGKICPKMSSYCLHSYNYCISFFFRFSLFQAPLQRRLFGVNSLFLLLAQWWRGWQILFSCLKLLASQPGWCSFCNFFLVIYSCFLWFLLLYYMTVTQMKSSQRKRE